MCNLVMRTTAHPAETPVLCVAALSPMAFRGTTYAEVDAVGRSWARLSVDMTIAVGNIMYRGHVMVLVTDPSAEKEGQTPEEDRAIFVSTTALQDELDTLDDAANASIAMADGVTDNGREVPALSFVSRFISHSFKSPLSFRRW